MEYRIELAGVQPDTAALNSILNQVDPSALADREPGSGGLRIATSLGVEDLLVLLHDAGVPADADHVVLLPSECCSGGCSG